MSRRCASGPNLLTLAPELFSAATVDRLPSKGDEAMIEHLDMLFRKKSTNTLLTRAHPLTRFVLWEATDPALRMLCLRASCGCTVAGCRVVRLLQALIVWLAA